MIQFESVTYRYPRQPSPALRDFDWRVQPGEFIALAGSSGTGKSTILRCVNGLVPHFHGGRFGGRVTVLGTDTTTAHPREISRRVGFVAQDPEAQTVMDRVEDEVAFGPENLGLTRAEIRIRVEEVLDLLGIAGLRHRPLVTLSGGERQRVVIAAAMAMRPEVLVLDEPTSQLDPWAAEEVLAVLGHLSADLGTTILLAEHRLDRVLGMADRLVVLDAGACIVADGPPGEAAPHLEAPPPLIRLALALGWDPLPLTVRDARRQLASARPHVPERRARFNRADPGQAAVTLEDVRFGYDDRPLFRSINASFQSGSITALMGRNGSGKSTLLKLINGLARPQSGRVVVAGRDIAGRSTAELARSVGYLPQNPTALLFNESVEHELTFTLRSQRRSGDIQRTLESLGLTAVAERHPLDLSTGERQRVALAAILVAAPSVLLLDEPTRGMDNRWKAELAAIMRALAREGVAVILATHDTDLVAETADRVMILGDGEIVAEGAPRDVLSGSMTYATQINRIFGGDILVLDDVLHALHPESDVTFPPLRSEQASV